jgi:hypothetical protein
MKQMNIEGTARELFEDWAELVPAEEWAVYQEAVSSLEELKVAAALGGAFGLACYTGRWRNTKDLDLYILPQDREITIQRLREIGFEDYYDRLPYDRRWIYRSVRQDVIIDLIWAMANRRTEVQPDWLSRAPRVKLRGLGMRVLPPEELLWCKLYVLQRDRCDWPDLINLLYSAGDSMDWERLFQHLGPDLPLLIGLLNVFGWVAPERASHWPSSIRESVHLPPRGDAPEDYNQQHINLLDSRRWFAALQPADQILEL